jgi:hypothetical protein
MTVIHHTLLLRYLIGGPIRDLLAEQGLDADHCDAKVRSLP